MSIRVALNHKTIYEYDRLVALSPHVIRLRPAPHCRTPIKSYSLKIEPAQHFLNWQQDPQSNYIARAVFPVKTRRLVVEVDLVAEINVINPFDFFLEPSAETYPFVYDGWLERELRPFLEVEEMGPRLREYIDSIDCGEMQSVSFLVGLNQRLQREVSYIVRMEPGIQTCEQTLRSGRGSCRDSAWLLVQILRQLGLAARFVSGYLIQLKTDVKSREGPEGPDKDFTDLHAWAEVYLPGAGWVGLDPTSGLFAAEGHLPVAATPDPNSASPISGSVNVSNAEFRHEISIARIHEAPRVTKPHTEKQWQAIDRLGHKIDDDLSAGDVRLTMGGQPTFVSIDDMDGPEWNNTAPGPDKHRMAEELIKRLRARFSPGGLLHYGQGKWYPGEPQPRWALTCYWRGDGEPLWRDPALIADTARDYGHGLPEAERFVQTLARQLAVNSEHAIPAYEDPVRYLRKEGKLPIDVTQEDNRLEERERLRQVFQRALGQPAGYVLPLGRSGEGAGRKWRSGPWMPRGKYLFLVPGDLPLGLRLPLESLPWVDPRHAIVEHEIDPFAGRGELPASALQMRRAEAPENAEEPVPLGGSAPAPADSPEAGDAAETPIRAAVAVQPRDGRLYVFLPPLASAEDFVDLIATVEDTAAELKMPVVMEGFGSPPDSRIFRLEVTPGIGVIKVNIHPAPTWRDLVKNTTALYEEARLCRLGAEKFMLDGRHSGTGGGNHFLLGGPTPDGSPFLRRPDLLRSLVAYWINHPALSYLFSGHFIGPKSQAPRVDEARSDSLYELEIAFEQIDKAGPDCPPWLLDRVFRHLLVDVTGSTHRVEFCIDKLYPPETASGRLGLLELRSFEMPPHARMSLAQQLLLRGLIAWFWREPYRTPPVHWGTRLHDDFMLPYFVEKDFADVIADLRRAGYEFEHDWFATHLAFRYPMIGSVEHGGIELELRAATEPWHVLGEETAGAATALYVDSSVERLQVKVRGSLAGRYVVACNERRLPLHPTGVSGEYVAGVRYRAWQPPVRLHPTIGVHTPLVFDVFDLWSERSLGGCTYHVAHPGGRTYDTFPVNATEAEARRAARFFPFGHTAGTFGPPALEQNPEFPKTLDLRRAPDSPH